MRRSMLFIPGNSPNLLMNADVLGSDSIILDLEDAVAPANPTRTETVEYTYTFLFWNNSYENVKSNVDVTAVYASTKQQYTVTFLDDLGNVLAEINNETTVTEEGNVVITFGDNSYRRLVIKTTKPVAEFSVSEFVPAGNKRLLSVSSTSLYQPRNL